MSTVIVDNVYNLDGQMILGSSGSIVQCVVARYDTRTSISASNSGNGTEITGLRLTITPRNAANRLICKWMVNGEFNNENAVFTIFKNGGLITTTNEWGYNSSTNSRWSGAAPSVYDTNNDSTGQNTTIFWSGIAGSTSSMFFAPATRSSNTANYTFYINRTVASNGQNAYEVPFSTGVCWEVAV